MGAYGKLLEFEMDVSRTENMTLIKRTSISTVMGLTTCSSVDFSSIRGGDFRLAMYKKELP